MEQGTRGRRVAAAAAIIGGLAAACGSGSAPAGKVATTDVAVELTEHRVSASPARAGTGDVTLRIANKGAMAHELVVVKTDLDQAKLPTDPSGEVDEKGAGLTFVDEREDIAVGAATTLELHLKAGSYVLLCNLPGHYALGMHATFEVAKDAIGSAASSAEESGASDDSGASAEAKIVPDFDVARGLANLKEQLAALGADLGTEPSRTMLGIYESWYSFEGAVRAKDQSTYLDMEDQLAAAKRAADANDRAKLAEATAAFTRLADAYLAAHPG